ncbi:MAG: leucyl aminopeptidase [Dehalococcoidaceae bacterium]|nr:leucyl aminopeptidase [Dehalococcoidaceae bacterium]
MEVRITAQNPWEVPTEALVVLCFKDKISDDKNVKEIDPLLSGAISRLVESREIKAKSGEVTVIHTLGKIKPERVVIGGMGKQEEFMPDFIRRSIAAVCKGLINKGIKELVVTFPCGPAGQLDSSLIAQLVTEGGILGSWSFKKYFTGDDQPAGIKTMALAAGGFSTSELQKGIDKGIILAEAANLARDMVNEPGNCLTPSDMAAIAEQVARDNGLEISVLDKAKMEEMGMRAVLAVAQGSANQPRFIIMKYRGTEASDIDLALVGKAVTFDSGGISIKPSEKMENMKTDMAGGASAIAAIQAIAKMKLAINVTALVAAVENLPSGTAQRPGDVVKSMSGKTIEVISTDAEGRMTLADVLSYAVNLGAKRIIDVATLTGACVVALGEVATGAFTNNQDLVELVKKAGDEAGEYMWQMPMYDEYKEQYKSDVADMKNVGGREAGAVTAALFLSEFAGSKPWVHLDIAGTSETSRDRGYWKKGGTGVPVRTLINLANHLAKSN